MEGVATTKASECGGASPCTGSEWDDEGQERRVVFVGNREVCDQVYRDGEQAGRRREGDSDEDHVVCDGVGTDLEQHDSRRFGDEQDDATDGTICL